jgi:SAM-dependent methyltransferase
LSDDRKTYFRALEGAKLAAFGPEDYIGQESFLTGSQVLHLAESSELTRNTTVLDLCCGAGGPALLLASATGCSILGVDRSAGAIALARASAHLGGLAADFLQAEVPPKLERRFEVVNLFETMLAFPRKQPLLQSISELLEDSGRFAFTFEEGEPLSVSERQAMPESATVHLTPREEMLHTLRETGFAVLHEDDLTASHAQVAWRLAEEYARREPEISSVIGQERVQSLIRGHRLWADWHHSGRSRKLAVVARCQR